MKKIKLKKENTAAFDVDVQYGFTPNCPNELPVPGGNEIVDECLKTHKMTKFKIMSKDAHPPKGKWVATDEKPVFSEVGLPNVDIRWPNHCVVGTKGFELLEGLPHPSEYDFIVYKGVETDMHPYSPIYHDLQKKISTGVIEFGKINQINNFILNGLALDYCLKEAAIDLAEYFNVYVNMSGTRGVNDETSIKAIKEMKEAGVIFIDSLDEIIIDNDNNVINKNFSTKGSVSKNSATGKFVPNVKKTLGNGTEY